MSSFFLENKDETKIPLSLYPLHFVTFIFEYEEVAGRSALLESSP